MTVSSSIRPTRKKCVQKNLAQLVSGMDSDNNIQKIRLLITVRIKEMTRDDEQLKVHVWAYGQDEVKRFCKTSPSRMPGRRKKIRSISEGKDFQI